MVVWAGTRKRKHGGSIQEISPSEGGNQDPIGDARKTPGSSNGQGLDASLQGSVFGNKSMKGGSLKITEANRAVTRAKNSAVVAYGAGRNTHEGEEHNRGEGRFD